MKINIPVMFLSTLIAALVNLLIYYTLGPIAALIEAVPGGVVIGVLLGILSPRPNTERVR